MLLPHRVPVPSRTPTLSPGTNDREFVVFAVLLIVTLLTGAAAAAAAPDADQTLAMLVQLQTGSDPEKIRAARWLGLHSVEDATEELDRIVRSIPLRSDRAELRNVALLMLRLIHQPHLVELRTEEEVLEGLDDPDPERRARAVRHVRYHGMKSMLPRMVEMLEDPASPVRAEAVTTVEHLDVEDRYWPELLRRMDDTDPAPFRSVLGTFWQHRDPELVPRLAELTAHPEHARLAIHLLRSWRYTEATMRALLTLIAAADDPEVLRLHLEALDELAPNRSRGPVVAGRLPAEPEQARGETRTHPSWTATLEPLLDHEDAGIRLQTAVLLSRDGNRAAVAY